MKPRTKGEIFIKELTSKEKLFCIYFASGRSPSEAAAKSGFRFGERAGLKLLKREEIRNEIRRCIQQRSDEKQDVSEGYYRLAFGCSGDGIKLLFKDEVTEEEIDSMDLFNISEIKRKKGGDIEIKFFDRLKALERLQQLCDEKDPLTGTSLYSAIASSAAALRDEALEQ